MTKDTEKSAERAAGPSKNVALDAKEVAKDAERFAKLVGDASPAAIAMAFAPLDRKELSRAMEVFRKVCEPRMATAPKTARSRLTPKIKPPVSSPPIVVEHIFGEPGAAEDGTKAGRGTDAC